MKFGLDKAALLKTIQIIETPCEEHSNNKKKFVVMCKYTFMKNVLLIKGN